MNHFEKPSQKLKLEQERRERLKEILGRSLEIFRSGEKLFEAAVAVTRLGEGGAIEIIHGLAVCDIDDQGVQFCGVCEDGEPAEQAGLLWSEIVDVQEYKE